MCKMLIVDFFPSITGKVFRLSALSFHISFKSKNITLMVHLKNIKKNIIINERLISVNDIKEGKMRLLLPMSLL